MKTLAEIYLEAMALVPPDEGVYCSWPVEYWQGMQEEHARTQALTKAVANCIEALTSIASEHKPSTETEEYWLKRSHEDCAMVLATDTKIARNALAELRAVVEAEGKSD